MCRWAVGAVLVAVTAGACSGGSEDAAPAPSASDAGPAVVETTPPPTCPPAKPSKARFPAPQPSDLPVPPGVTTMGKNRRTSDGVDLVQFSTDTDLRSGVLFLLERVEAAGYTLGRGDAEVTEADAPFSKGATQGIYRLITRGPCRTDWLLATTKRRAGGSPLLPVRPSASRSPLPFG